MDEKHLYELTRDLAERWSENAEDHIKQKIECTLDKRLEELILVLCGFEKEYSKYLHNWKVDHCNNRSGNSPIGQIINEAIKDKLTMISRSVSLSAEEEREVKSEYKRAYLKEYRRQMISQAGNLGKKHADAYSKKAIETALEGAAESVRLRLMEVNE